MIESIREYLETEFECGVNVGDADGDVRLSFTFAGVERTVVVTGAILREPPRDVMAFLTRGEETLADVIVIGEGAAVVVEPKGYRIIDS